jgi:hypothetical protein
VENCGNLNCSPGLPANAIFRACSACAGDYEDPDRTAGNGSEESDETEEGGEEQKT